MSRSINALVGIIGAIAGIVSALVGLIQVGLVEAPEPDRSAAIHERPATYRPSPRVREDFEPITIDDDRGRIRRTDLDRLPLPRAPLPPLGLSPNFGDLSEALESAALLRERLFRNDRRSVDELFESMNRAERRERLGQDVDRRGRR